MAHLRVIGALRWLWKNFHEKFKKYVYDWSRFKEVFTREMTLEFGFKEWKNLEKEREMMREELEEKSMLGRKKHENVKNEL